MFTSVICFNDYLIKFNFIKFYLLQIKFVIIVNSSKLNFIRRIIFLYVKIFYKRYD